MPEPEARLWYHLRARRFACAKFRRQVVIGRYIVDFACRIPTMLIVEVDGDTHAGQQGYDARRDEWLRSLGYDLVRFTNQEVMTNLDGVLWKIQQTLGLCADAPSLPPPFGGSFSPLNGRDERAI